MELQLNRYDYLDVLVLISQCGKGGRMIDRNIYQGPNGHIMKAQFVGGTISGEWIDLKHDLKDGFIYECQPKEEMPLCVLADPDISTYIIYEEYKLLTGYIKSDHQLYTIKELKFLVHSSVSCDMESIDEELTKVGEVIG